MANCHNIPNIYYSEKEVKYFGLEILVLLEHCFECFQVYILIQLYHNQKRKNLNYLLRFFFTSSDTHKSHHLLGCHVTSINSSFNSFFECFTFFKFSLLDKKTVLNTLKINKICLTRKLS